jgi:hypothetical protein
VRLPPLLPGARFADVYDIVLLVDNREQVRQTALQGVYRLDLYRLLLGLTCTASCHQFANTARQSCSTSCSHEVDSLCIPKVARPVLSG